MVNTALMRINKQTIWIIQFVFRKLRRWDIGWMVRICVYTRRTSYRELSLGNNSPLLYNTPSTTTTTTTTWRNIKVLWMRARGRFFMWRMSSSCTSPWLRLTNEEGRGRSARMKEFSSWFLFFYFYIYTSSSCFLFYQLEESEWVREGLLPESEWVTLWCASFAGEGRNARMKRTQSGFGTYIYAERKDKLLIIFLFHGAFVEFVANKLNEKLRFSLYCSLKNYFLKKQIHKQFSIFEKKLFHRK